MAFTVDLYTFSKKINSTARPSTPDASYSCIIKESCAVLSPVIGLNLGLTSSPSNYNYAYIPIFDRYYFIKDWTFENAVWYATMEVDALASWKNSIGNSSCYVLRSATEWNGAILDTTYPATNTTTIEYTEANSPWVTDDMANGCYVVGVAGQRTTYYIFLQSGLELFFEWLFSDAYVAALCGEDWAAAFKDLKARANPLQFITSVMWYPFQTTGTAVDTIRVGFVNVPVAAWRVDGSGVVGGQIIFGANDSLHRHPQVWRGEFLNNAPYSTYSLFFPPWGTIHLDSDIIANVSQFTAQWIIDLRTGAATLLILAGTQEHVISWLHSQIGVHYQVSQVVNSGYGFGNSFIPAISTAANLAAGNVIGATATVSAQLGDFARSKIPSATTIGSMGGIDSLRGAPRLQYEFKELSDNDMVNRGAPLCEVRDINTLSGFIQVSNAYIDLAATQPEKDAIIGFMEGGFFYE